ncbi:ABC transporter permease [Terrimonas sp.]|uniref:ABC transporter permease n=1 Tax=Terrimonas sp. TaxID=1914338 RepID=UPI000D52193B|nr:ABC transporter permease [Terrimonas sp.]PVD50426.1 ABC transporter permease [Terrimonas sp.]
MFRNYLKTAWRNITRTIGYSTLNVAGLAIGMAVALMIGLWVYDQYSFDRFLPGHQSVYRVQRNYNSNGDTLTFQTTSLKLAEALHTQIPEIEYVAESDWTGNHGLIAGDKKLYVSGAIAGPDIFKIFQYSFIEGNADNAFKDPYSIVLTASLARSLFGNADAMNKTVRFDNANDLKITGIINDVPANATFSFNYIVPSTYVYAINPQIKTDGLSSFSNNNRQIFVKLRPGVNYAQVAPKIRNIEHTEEGNTNAMNSYITLQPMERWHLYSNYINGKDTPGFLAYVKMFSIIGLLVLIIACINFVNLTTARSEKRAKEVAVRKAIGSQKRDLVIQFLMEAFLLTAIAFVFAIAIAWISLPAFNTLTSGNIVMPFGNIYFWVIMLGCLLLTALLAGSRPAFYLSSFNPVTVLKGTIQSGKSSLSRKVLVIIQFSCSIALIVSTVIIYQQIQYAKTRPTGFNLNRLMATNMNDDLDKHFTALKNEVLQKGIVSAMTTATSPATNVWWHSDVEQWPGKNPGETVEMGTIIVSGDYFKTVGMDMSEGRNFSHANDSTSVIFNEAAIKRMRIKNPVGQKINWQGHQLTIAGVVQDALMVSPFSAAEPTMFLCNALPQGNLLYRLAPGIQTQDAIARLTAIFNKYDPAYPYNYSFADEQYAQKFKLEMLIGKLAGLFAVLAIFISCLGLFGLAAYVAEQRTKEIGIRKVLGASIQQLWLLLSKDFIVLVLISCLIAAPISFYFLHNWLQHYDYRINIGAGVFVAGGLMSLIITMLTVSFQAIKAAIANPVKSLRTE